MSKNKESMRVAYEGVKFLRANKINLEDTNPHIVAAYIADVEGYKLSINALARKIIYVWGNRK